MVRWDGKSYSDKSHQGKIGKNEAGIFLLICTFLKDLSHIQYGVCLDGPHNAIFTISYWRKFHDDISHSKWIFNIHIFYYFYLYPLVYPISVGPPSLQIFIGWPPPILPPHYKWIQVSCFQTFLLSESCNCHSSPNFFLSAQNTFQCDYRIDLHGLLVQFLILIPQISLSKQMFRKK